MNRKNPIFSSKQEEELYYAAYDKTLRSWPVAYEDIYVDTSFGKTHMLASGPEDGLPIVLLHAVTNSSTQWFPNIGELSEQYRCYSIDIIGDAGKSILNKTPSSRQEFVQWLEDVLNQLKIDRTHLIGHSYGGWFTLCSALYIPHRLNKIVLLAPAASIHPFSPPVWLALKSSSLPFKMPFQPGARKVLESMLVDKTMLNDDFVKQMEVMLQTVTTELLFPDVLKPEELQKIHTPALLLLGEQEIIYNPKAAIRRARRYMPALEADLLPNCSHLLTMEQATRVNQKVLAFLGN